MTSISPGREGTASVWIVIPTTNEAENLGRLIPALQAHLSGRPFQLLIVDDASTDATASVVEEFRRQYGNVTLYRRPARLGLGTALRDGLAQALADPQCEFICTLDADGSHDPAQLPALLDAAARAAFMQGSRYIPGGRILHWSWSRRLMSRAANRLCRWLGSRLREHTTNYRVYSREAAAVAIAASTASGFEWIVSASLAIQAAALPVAEVPITFKGREAGESKLSRVAVLRYGLFFLRALMARVAEKARVGVWFPIGQRWFRWGLLAHLTALLLLAHVYDMAVFQDASARLARGEGIYAPFATWVKEHGDGYYAYPPIYAYMLWGSGRLAALFGGQWWIHQILIKGWMFLADLAVFGFLHRLHPRAAQTYWTLWFVPVVAIAQVQPDLWVGLTVLLAFSLARRDRWTAAGLALAAGIGLKATPLVIVPFLLLHLLRRRRWAAAQEVVGAVALGLVIVWVPYLVFFDDAGQFGEVLRFHLSRPAFGLNLAGGLRSVVDASVVINALAGGEAQPAAAVAIADQQIAALYPLLPVLAFSVLGIAAYASRWSLEQVFGLPLLTFLLANTVVNEQYLLQVLPLLLVTAPAALGRLAWPYSIYVLAAGTPLRFFPREYGFPLTPEALLSAAARGTAAPLIALLLAGAIGGAALLFSYRVYRLIQESLRQGRQKAQPAPLLQPEGAR
jgi:hypothetical protein